MRPVVKAATERSFGFCNKLYATLILCHLLQAQRCCRQWLSATPPEPLTSHWTATLPQVTKHSEQGT